MRFKLRGGGDFKQGEFFRKKNGSYVYMVVEQAYASLPGKGVSFQGKATSLETQLSYVVCGYWLFNKQISEYNDSGMIPRDIRTLEPKEVHEYGKKPTKIQEIIEAIEMLPDLVKLAKVCLRDKKLLDEESELG